MRLASTADSLYVLQCNNPMPEKRLSNDSRVLIGMAAVLTMPLVLTPMTIAQSRASRTSDPYEHVAATGEQ